MKDDQITGLAVMGAAMGSRHELDQALASASAALTSALENGFSADPKSFQALQDVIAVDPVQDVGSVAASDDASASPLPESMASGGSASLPMEGASLSTVVLDDGLATNLDSANLDELIGSIAEQSLASDEAQVPAENQPVDGVEQEISSGLSKVDDALYGDFRDFTYELYNSLEAGNKAVGNDIDQGLEGTGLPVVGDVLDPFLEFEYVETLSAGPSQTTIAARSLIGDLNAYRAELLADLY